MHPYAREIYAQSLFHIGEHLFVPAWNTYVLKRPILIDDAIVGYDALGLYPIAILSPSVDVKSGLEFLRNEGLVSVVLVLDDFHRPPMEALTHHFELCNKMKTHYIFDPHQTPIMYDKHHRYELRQAHKTVRTEIIDLSQYIESWIALYSSLSDRHHLTGHHNFPIEHFITLSKMDDVVTFGAFIDDQLVSCHIWVQYEGYAHSHLAASNEQGYISRAAYALNDFSLRYFKDCSVINFGGGAGLSDKNDGLSQFKKGFSNRESPAFICGEILDKNRYDALTALNDAPTGTTFFPAYRSPRNGDLK